jgi:hypothetical protein
VRSLDRGKRRRVPLQVRSLGRGGGKGPLRRAPEEVFATRNLPGVIRSALVPEQVQGLYKSGSLTQMLPSEAGLMAMGWPRHAHRHREGCHGGAGAGVGAGAALDAAECSSDGESTADEIVEARGSHPARLLFKARLAEKGLLSYERAGTIRTHTFTHACGAGGALMRVHGACRVAGGRACESDTAH